MLFECVLPSLSKHLTESVSYSPTGACLKQVLPHRFIFLKCCVHLTIAGTCFTSLAEDMKNVYAPYCRNHDDVINLIEKVGFSFHIFLT